MTLRGRVARLERHTLSTGPCGVCRLEQIEVAGEEAKATLPPLPPCQRPAGCPFVRRIVAIMPADAGSRSAGDADGPTTEVVFGGGFVRRYIGLDARRA